MIYCDRCHKLMNREDWEGWLSNPFFRDGWDIVFKEGEEVLCEECFKGDPLYQRVYGRQLYDVWEEDHSGIV